MARLYLSPPHMGDDERTLLLDAFDSNWIAPLGPHVDAFEREFAEYIGAAAAAALSSGTAGLHLALLLAGVRRGDAVVVPSFTFAATANAVCYLGATPIFVDSEADTWNLDPDLLEDELGDRQRRGELPAAVIVVDLYGQCAQWDRISAVCDRFGVAVVEDAAEALGARFAGRAAGSFGQTGIFSFNGNKIITTSGGGMLASDDVELVDRARRLASQAREPALHYEHAEIGFNYRLSNLLAAIGRAQLRGLPDKVARKRAINARYRELFADLPEIAFMPNASGGDPTNWLTVITVDPAFGAPHEICARLDTVDIEARPAWKPMHLQPVFQGCSMRGGAVSEQIFLTGVCLPSGSAMTDSDVERVAESVRRVGRVGR